MEDIVKRSSLREIFRKKRVLLLFIILLTFLLFFFPINKGSMTLFSVSYSEEDVVIPRIERGKEIIDKGYKYANNSEVIVSSLNYVSCFWKPPKEDDGWKICEVIFEIEDKRQVKAILKNPKIGLDFEKNNVRNVEVSYSEDYEIKEEIYEEVVLDDYEKEIFRKNESFSSKSGGIEVRKGKERTGRIKEVIIEKIVKKEKIKFNKREFKNFKEFVIMDDFENNESLIKLTGSAISLDSGDLKIQTKKPFAIKIKFEIPKYEANSFNFRIFEGGFDAYIDPLVSGCGILNASDSVYILNQSVEATQNCFVISGNNITLDCDGYDIKYGNSSEQTYGVYSTSNSTTIKNCNINKSSNQIYGAGIYLEGDNSLVENNTIFSYGNYIYGISFSGSDNTIRNNSIFTYGIQGYGIYSLGSDSDIINNLIETIGHKGCAVYFNSGSNNDINENIFNTSHNDAYGIYLNLGSEDNTISGNQIFTLGTVSSAIYLDQGSNLNLISENNISTYGEEGYGVWMEDCSYNFVEDNKINTFNEGGYGILIAKSNFSEFINNEVSTRGIYASTFYFDQTSDGNKISRAYVKTNGTYSYPIEVFYGRVNFSINDSVLTNLNEDIEFFVYGLNDYIEGVYTEGIWNFTNTSLSNLIWNSKGNGQLNAKNYLEIFVSSANVNISGAEVSISGGEVVSGLTDSNGFIKIPLIYSVQNNTNGSDITYFDYTVRVSEEGYEVYESIFNMSSNQVLEIVLTEVVQVSGGSGRGPTCVPNWSCLSWSECINGSQTEICEDLNNCNIKRPDTKRSCKVNSLTEEQPKRKERGVLFDVYVRIIKEEISSSEKLLSSVGLVNLGIPGQVDINLTYQIKDFSRVVVYEEREIVPVETHMEFIKEIDISNLEDGEYTLFLDLTYVGQTEPAQAESSFYVGIKKPGNLLESKGFKIAIVVILIIAIVFIIVLVFFLRKRRSNQSSKSIDLRFP